MGSLSKFGFNRLKRYWLRTSPSQHSGLFKNLCFVRLVPCRTERIREAPLLPIFDRNQGNFGDRSGMQDWLVAVKRIFAGFNSHAVEM